jgi:dolichol-phosphate mannosyltransferase
MPESDKPGSLTTPGTTDVLVSVCAVLSGDLGDIEQFLDETSRILSANFRYYELLLIDNSSDEGLTPRAQDWLQQAPNVRLLRLSRRYSQEIALAAALDNSIGDYVVVMEIATDPPAMIPEMIAVASAGHDVVIAERDGNQDPLITRWLSRGFCRIATVMLGYPLRPDATYFRAFSRRAVNSLIRIRSKNRYLRCLNGLVGFRQASIPHTGRTPAGRRGVRHFWSSARSGVDIIISNSAAPLRIGAMLGLIASFVNVLYFAYILVVTLVKKRLAEGWLTMSITTTTMFFLMFIILSILSEYIARILDESKDQPLYFIESEANSSLSSFQKDRLNVL